MSLRFVIKLAALASTCWFSISDALAENRIALVIGNSGYTSVTPLPNPANDARDMAKFLTSAGFEVVQAPNLTQRDMLKAIGNFASKVSEKGPDTVALVFYAGHGLQVDGENFLVPIDAQIEREGDVPLQAMRLADLMKALSTVPSKSRIVILDACRNNPFSAINKTAGRGLAIVDAPNGSLVAYSTAPGTEALDGDGDHSPFTTAFLGFGREPGLPIEQVLKKVRLQVSNATQRQQFPWESSSLTTEFSFFPTGAEPQQVVASNEEPRTYGSVRSRSRSVEHWKTQLKSKPARVAYETVVQEDTVEAYEAYLALYPYDPLALTVWNLFDRRNEMIAWSNAVTMNTPVAYQTFLAKYGKSDLATAAHRLVERTGIGAKPAWANDSHKATTGVGHDMHRIQNAHGLTTTHVSPHTNNSVTTKTERTGKNFKPQNATRIAARSAPVVRAKSFAAPRNFGSMAMSGGGGHMGGGGGRH